MTNELLAVLAAGLVLYLFTLYAMFDTSKRAGSDQEGDKRS